MRVAAMLLAVATLPASPLLAQADDGWRYRLTPYLWFAGLKGDVATIPGAPAAPIEFSPGEALEDTETGLMLVFDVDYDDNGFLYDARQEGWQLGLTWSF